MKKEDYKVHIGLATYEDLRNMPRDRRDYIPLLEAENGTLLASPAPYDSHGVRYLGIMGDPNLYRDARDEETVCLALSSNLSSEIFEALSLPNGIENLELGDRITLENSKGIARDFRIIEDAKNGGFKLLADEVIAALVAYSAERDNQKPTYMNDKGYIAGVEVMEDYIREIKDLKLTKVVRESEVFDEFPPERESVIGKMASDITLEDRTFQLIKQYPDVSRSYNKWLKIATAVVELEKELESSDANEEEIAKIKKKLIKKGVIIVFDKMETDKKTQNTREIL